MNRYSFFTSNEIKPQGWIKRQLEIQLSGLTGNLHKFWPDIRDSKWIGGSCEGWERVPYWLDGAIPLAFLLSDSELKDTVKKYIDAILSQQCEDGWICPCTEEERPTYDTWAVLLISKVLVRWYECSGDRRVPKALYRCMKNYYDLLSSGRIKLFDWGKFRWFEAFPALNFLYGRYKEEWIKDLARIIKDQGAFYRDFEEQWKRPLNKWTFSAHIVNLMQMLKSEVLSCDLLGEDYSGLADEYYGILSEYNGTSVGIITGDECLSGISPIQGTELCAVAELMDSLEQLYAYTGDTKWADLLEKVAFNAYPATVSEDMTSHQYDQMANQISCVPFPGKSLFRTNSSDAHVFGLEPNYGCCTANMHQAWPKLVLSSFIKGRGEVISALLIPSELGFRHHGNGIKISLASDYPFRTAFRYTVSCEKNTSLRLKIRIPHGAENVILNSKAADIRRGFVSVSGFEAGETVLDLSFTFTPKLMKRPNGMFSAYRGPLVYCVHPKEKWTPVEYERNGVERKYPFCDYYVEPQSRWSYAFCGEELSFAEHRITDIPFSGKNPPVGLKTRLVPIGWGYEDGYDSVCAKYPLSAFPEGEPEEIELIPYGCARLRMTELPKAKRK